MNKGIIALIIGAIAFGGGLILESKFHWLGGSEGSGDSAASGSGL